MKTIVQILAACFFLFLLPQELQAQSAKNGSIPAEAKQRVMLRRAYNFLYGLNNQEINYNKAAVIFQSLAKENNADALYMLGIMHLEGKGFEPNDTLALRYFIKAAKQGHGKAALDVGKMKKNNEDWSTYEEWEKNARQVTFWFNKAVELGSKKAHYALGYAYYKGYGVSQNYKKAVEEFERSAAANELPGIYMLGYCYLNGYGVERDALKGKSLIRKAADKGYNRAMSFVARVQDPDNFTQAMIDLDDNLKERVQLPEVAENKAPKQFEQVTNNVQKYRIRTDNACVDTVSTISGLWSGKLISYDWSGQTIVDEQKISLSIYEIAGKLYGSWSDDSNAIEISATLKDTVWVFDHTPVLYQREEANSLFYEKQAIDLKFATFNYECNEEGEFLTGNLWRYAPRLNEFIQPAVMVLTKNVVLDPVSAEKEDEDGRNGMKIDEEEVLDSQSVVVYPNPFTNLLNLRFTLTKPIELTITIYSSTGAVVYSKSRKYVTGEQFESLVLSPLSGIYALHIYGIGVNYSTQIVKN